MGLFLRLSRSRRVGSDRMTHSSAVDKPEITVVIVGTLMPRPAERPQRARLCPGGIVWSPAGQELCLSPVCSGS